MKVKKVNRYYAECGKGYWSRSSCENHEANCKCWKNPKFKTCLSCSFHEKSQDSSRGVGTRDFHSWYVNSCTNPAFDYDRDFTPVHHKASDICGSCPRWEGLDSLSEAKDGVADILLTRG